MRRNKVGGTVTSSIMNMCGLGSRRNTQVDLERAEGWVLKVGMRGVGK